MLDAARRLVETPANAQEEEGLPMKIRVLLAAFGCTLLLAAPAQAISNGVLDGNGHPYVGAVVYEFDGEKSVGCSGTLISATVFLTAGHCLAGLPPTYSGLSVSFSSDTFAALNDIPAVAFHVMPGFGHDLGDLKDLAVIILPAGSTAGITPAVLPTAGLLGQMAANGGLVGTSFDNVGYGVHPAWKKAPPSFGFDGKRWFSTSPFQGLTKTWLKLLMNNDATGEGGVCYGDSGSGHFLPGTNRIVATTTGGDAVCRAESYNYRLDTAVARAFLDDYVTLP
jgi:hypothetical protein